MPRFYQPSNLASAKIESDSSLIALEALNLATLNVIGFGVMTTGGLAWAFDIMNLSELRALARRNLATEGGARTDEEAEEEVEQWVAKVLLRRDQKEQKDDAGDPKSRLPTE